MIQMIIHHSVEDFAKWKPVFDEHSTARAQNGSKSYRLLRATDNPNHLLVIFDWENEEKAREFAESTHLKETMERAGVTSKPHIRFWKEVEARDDSGEEKWARSA